MNPSREARDLLDERRRWRRGWDRAWPWIALALVFGWAAADAWWVREQSRLALVEKEQDYIASQDRCAGIIGLPKVSFVLTGEPATIYDSLRTVSHESDSMRVLMLKASADARATPKIPTFLPQEKAP